uniref:Uncharacterized protein n=1 Tax=Photinus pyralis TaxID=7054 RepID=A0A1Y1KKZ9_PHOPY
MFSCIERRLRVVFAVVLLAHGERNVAILDHMLNLLAHRQDKENNPIHDQDGPEDGNVEKFEEGAEEGDGDGTGSPVPKLELGKTPNEGLELLILLGREGPYGTIFHVLVDRIVGRVKFGLEESQKQVEQINAERIGNNVPSLDEKNAHEEEQ